MRQNRSGNWIDWSGPYLYALVLLVVFWASRFAILSNDTFPLLFQAEHLSLSDRGSFFNGFFPIGYPLLLRGCLWIGGGWSLAVLIQLLSLPLYYHAARSIMANMLERGTGQLAFVTLLCIPTLVRAELSAVPDYAAALAAIIALAAVLRGDYVKAGLALGMGYLFRFHEVVFAVAVIVSLLLFLKASGFRSAMRCLLAFLPFVLIQGLVQVWSGHGFFESSQAFNVWKMAHPIDWSHPPHAVAPSIWNILGSEPATFITAYLQQLIDEWWVIVLPLAALLLSQNEAPRMRAVLLSSLLYSLAVAAGGSARGDLLVMPISVLAGGILLQRLIPHNLRNVLTGVRWRMGVIAAIIVVALVFAFRGATNARARIASYDRLPSELRLRDGQSKQILTDDFALYFPEHRDCMPQVFGGWAPIGLPTYAERVAVISDSSQDALYNDCERAGIRWLVFRQEPLNPRALALASGDTDHYASIPSSTGYRVFRVK